MCMLRSIFWQRKRKISNGEMGVTPCFFFAPKDKKAAAKDMVILCRRSYCGVSIRLLALIITIEESNDLSAGAVVVRAEQTAADKAERMIQPRDAVGQQVAGSPHDRSDREEGDKAADEN